MLNLEKYKLLREMSEEDRERIYEFTMELSKRIVEGTDKEILREELLEYLEEKKRKSLEHAEVSSKYFLFFPSKKPQVPLKACDKEDAIEEARELLSAGQEKQAIFYSHTGNETNTGGHFKTEGLFADSGRLFYSPQLEVKILADGTLLPTVYLDVKKS